jgi:hypothetical protein
MHRLQELVRLHRMGTGAREVARVLQVSPNTERDYRRALAAEGLLDGDAGDVPPLEVLRAAVERHLPVVAPPQMVSTAEPVRDSSSSRSSGSSRRPSTIGCGSRTRTSR